MTQPDGEPRVEVQLVLPLARPRDELRAQVTSPQAGDRHAARALTISGWALTAAGPAASVEVSFRGGVLATALVGDSKPQPPRRHSDVPAFDRSGFVCVTPLAGLPPHLDLDVNAVLGDGTRCPVARLRLRWEAPRPPSDDRLLVPIAATGMPRAGTTWLMRLLADHPDVVAQRRYPYECSTAKYWAYLYDVLTQPAGIVHRGDALPFAYDIWNVGNGALPATDGGEAWFGKAHIRRLADLARGSIDDWYRTLAEEQSEPQAGFFAEKFWPDKLPVVMRELYGDVREVFIVRDFRDVVHSTLAFEQQLPWPATMATRELRGEGALRRAERSDPESVADYVRSMILPTALGLRAGWRRRRDEATLVRYEDLVAHPEATVARLFGDLGLDHEPAIVTAALAGSADAGAGVKGHRTSADAAASVGRWKREADAELIALYDEVFGELLEEFGYEDG